MRGELQLSLLGNPRLAKDGAAVTGFAHRKSLALLAYLAVTGRAHSRDALAGLLFSRSTQANARAGLRKLLADLGRHLARHLTITRHTIAFNAQAPHRLDAEAFERPIQRALQAPAGLLTEGGAVALAEAIEWYKGDFLEGFSVHGAAAFEEWALLQRERLRLLLLRALHRLSIHYAASGAYAPAIERVAHLLELEPAQEAAHRQLMTLLALSGDRDLALRQYEVCRQALADHLQVEPAAETTALFDRIGSGAQLSELSPSLPDSLPIPLTRLFGREAELARIAELLQRPSCRLLSLVGPGGSGKTHLALAAAAAQRTRFADGVCYVPLASLQSAAAIAPDVARRLSLNLAPLPGPAEPQRQLWRHLQPRQMLLVMDGFEHLLAGTEPGQTGGAAAVDAILRAAPGVKVLATSRIRLNLQGEHVLSVGGLHVPEDDGGGAFAHSAVQLFLDAARRACPDFAPAADEWVHVIRICRELRGLPLAILLAANWLTMLSPAQIATRVSDESGHGLDLLQADWADLPARQRSMRAVFHQTWSLLAGRQRKLLQGLSLLRGSFTPAAARHLTGADLTDLRALSDRSLLHLAAGDRYELHELLRRYALQKLQHSPAAEISARDRHCAYFGARLQAWYADLNGAAQHDALAAMAADSHSTRAAWIWAVQRGHLARLAQAADGLGTYYLWSGRYQEGDAAFELAARALSTKRSEDPEPVARRLLAKALAWRGVFQHALGRLPQAQQLLQHSLTLLDDPPLAAQPIQSDRAFALWRLGEILCEQDVHAARRRYEESLALFRELGNDWGAANVLDALGRGAAHMGDHNAARLAWEEGLALREHLGDDRGILRSVGQLSGVARSATQLTQDQRRPAAPPPAERGAVGRPDVPPALQEVSRALSLGRYADAQYLLDHYPADSADSQPADQGLVRLVQAMVHAHQGRYAEARARALECLARCEASGCQWAIEMCCRALGMVSLAEGEYAQAEQWLRRSTAICRRTRQWADLGFALACKALASARLAQVPQARLRLAEALRLAVATKLGVLQLVAVQAAALLLAAHGQSERAVELHALASRYPAVANSRWCHDVCGKHIAAVAATLAPRALHAAQSRGRARELEATVEELAAQWSTAPDHTSPFGPDVRAPQTQAA